METDKLSPPLPSRVLPVLILPLCIWAVQSRAASQAFGIGQVTPNATAISVAMQQLRWEEAKCAQVLAGQHSPFD